MEIQLEPVANSSGQIVINAGYNSILDVPVSTIVKLFKAHGLLWLRGFNVSAQEFESFSKRFTTRFVIDPDRSIDPDNRNVQKVGDGNDEILLHCENAASPFRADIIWFCCITPAEQDGATTFCDTVRLWEELSESTKKLFLDKKIKYMRTYSSGSLKRFFGPGVTISSLREMVDKTPGVRYEINDDGSVYSEYVCPAIMKSRWGGKIGFANSVLYNSLSPNRAYKLAFDDDTPIPDEVIEEIYEKAMRLCGLISWEAGDVAMLDNVKFMHGRRGFTDPRRHVIIMQGIL